MTKKKFKKGEVIFRQGDEGACFYQVVDGSVEIFENYGQSDQLKLTELEKGAFFGEMAVIESYPRSASAVAGDKGAKVEVIGASEVNSYLDEHPENILALMQHLGNRLRDLTKDYNEVSDLIRELGVNGEEEKKESFFEKCKKHIGFYKSHMKDAGAPSAETLREMNEDGHAQGFSKKVEQFPAGTVICREGGMGDCMYDIHWGKIGIYTGYGTDDEILLTELYPNSFFGEMGMISKEPRSATAVALEDTTLELIYPEDLSELFEKNPVKVNMILRHLSGRLRRLTEQYLSACSLVYSYSEKLNGNQPISDELSEKIKAYKMKLYD